MAVIVDAWSGLGLITSEEQARAAGFMSIVNRYRIFAALFERARVSSEEEEAAANLGHWLAAMSIIVDAWSGLGYSHSAINSFAADPRAKSLRLFREYFSSFHGAYDSDRHKDLLREQRKILPWARQFARALDKVFAPHAQSIAGSTIPTDWIMTGHGSPFPDTVRSAHQ